MINMKAIKTTIVFVLFCQAVLAQKVSPEQRATQKVQMLDEKVSLTETQKEQVQAIFNNTASQTQNLRKQEVVDENAIRELRKEEREKVKAVLTAEQQAKLKEIRKEHRTENKESRDKLKAYHEANVKPIMKEKRLAFDSKLSESEKAIIAQARALKPKHKKDHHLGELKEDEKTENKAAREQIKTLLGPIVDAHKAELQQIFADVKPILDAERAFVEENKPQTQQHKKGPDGKGERGKQAHQNEHFMYQFLLMK